MAQPVNERVLVLNPTRVHAALAALIEATAGPQVAAPIGSSVAVGAIGRFVEATVTVLDVAAGHSDDDFATIRALPERRTVIAVGTATAAGIRALQAETIAVCDKTGDPEALTATIEAAARCRPARLHHR